MSTLIVKALNNLLLSSLVINYPLHWYILRLLAEELLVIH